jgi:hypothetical protein
MNGTPARRESEQAGIVQVLEIVGASIYRLDTHRLPNDYPGTRNGRKRIKSL